MGVNYNPRVVTNGLVMCLDAGNPFKSAKGFKNLLDLSTWTLGTGSVTGFSQNGTTAENQRILDTGPFGVSALVWDTPSNDATSDSDGGWDGASISIDKTKMYRFSVWMRRRVIGNGSYYLGCAGGVLNRSDGVLNNNPYFSASSWPVSIVADQWMLIVGHIWPVESGTGTNHIDSGLWNTSGTKFSGPTYNGDFVWQTSSTTTNLRSYLYYSTDTTTRQQWYQPRIDLVDGTEPTVAELIAGVGSKWYDLAGTNHGNILNSAALYNNAGYMTFDGVDDFVDTNTSGSTFAFPNTTFTISVWIKTSVTGYTTIPGIMIASKDYTFSGGGWAIGIGIPGYNGSTTVSFFASVKAIGGYFVNYTSTQTAVNDGQWKNLVAVIRTDTAVQENNINTLYINGVQSAVNTFTNGNLYNPPTLAMNIGRRSTGSYFPGNLAQISIYDRALSASEIQQNFNATRGKFGI
jgi:hypothetical protein